MLHGVVSHSEWLRPIAVRLASHGFEVICPDRRGAGLNHLNSGDAPSLDALIQDLGKIFEYYGDTSIPIHLAGYCWGASYAIRFVETSSQPIESLILVAPSIFPAHDIATASLTIGDSGYATEIPNVPVDRFTLGDQYATFIAPDKLRTRRVSPRFNKILTEVNQMLSVRWSKLQLPCLVVLAEDDRLSDNAKHERAFEKLRAVRKQLTRVKGEHGVQFDAPDETSAAIAEWILDRSS